QTQTRSYLSRVFFFFFFEKKKKKKNAPAGGGFDIQINSQKQYYRT
ncbi:hypothetical protein HMPREF9532_03289, partial [Escherichia coli MS 57-2]